MQLPPGLVQRSHRQHGAFTTRQANEEGIDKDKLARLVRNGVIRRVRLRVYVSATQPDSWELDVMAAVLAGGRGAVASHGTAAKLHGTYWGASDAIEITIPHERRSSLQGVVVHRSVHLDPVDLTEVNGIPTTTRARTIRDLAIVHREPVLEKAVDENVATGVPIADIADRVEACGPIVGRPKLRRVLARHDPEMEATRAEVERMCLRIARRSGISGIVANHEVVDRYGRTRFLDLAVPPHLVGLEVDTDRHHGTTLGRHRDGRRQNALVLDGWLILRFDLEDLKRHRGRVAEEIRSAVAMRNT